MNWKKFFKPNLNKIMTAIGVLILLAIIINLFRGCFCGQVCPAGQVLYQYFLSCKCKCMLENKALTRDLLVYALVVVISYIISCIIFIKDSLKK